MERLRLFKFNEKGIAWFTGHCLAVMRGLPSECIQAVVTSPPYWGLRSYSTVPQIWGGQENCKHEWEKGRRISDGNAPSNKTGLKSGLDKMRKQPVETTTGDTCGKCGAWKGELGNEPTPKLYIEHLCKVFSEVNRILKPGGIFFLNLGDSYASGHLGRNDEDAKNIERRAKAFGTGKLKAITGGNKGIKVIQNTGLISKNLIGIPWRAAFALQDSGWILRSENIWWKRNALPESVKDRPNRDHEHIFMFVKQPKYYFDMDAVRMPVSAATRERDKYTRITNGKDGQYAVAHNHETPSNELGRNLRTVWDIPTRPFRESHFAVYPPALPERCIKMASKPGDIILDPFGGSGCTAYVAAKLGRRCISIELNPNGQAMAARRAGKIAKGFFGNYDITDK